MEALLRAETLDQAEDTRRRLAGPNTRRRQPSRPSSAPRNAASHHLARRARVVARAEGSPYSKARGSAPGIVRGGRGRGAGGRAGRQASGACGMPRSTIGAGRLHGDAGRGAVGERSSGSASKRRAAPCRPLAAGAGRGRDPARRPTGTRSRAGSSTPLSSRSCSPPRARRSAPETPGEPQTRSPTRSPSGAGPRSWVCLSLRGRRPRQHDWTRCGSTRWRSASRRRSPSESTAKSSRRSALPSKKARSASACGDS